MKLLFYSFCILIIMSSVTAQEMTYFFQGKDIMSASQTDLHYANTLEEMHNRYKGEWVDEYISTKISISSNGKTKEATGINNNLTTAQKSLLKEVEVGSIITVWVNYIPNNSLKHNPPREIEYTFNVIPAQMPRPISKVSLEDYIQKYIIQLITPQEKEEMGIVNLKFNVQANGEIANANFIEKTGIKSLDEMIYKAICNMPKWTPAQTLNKDKIDFPMNFYMSKTKTSCLLPLKLDELENE